MNKINNFMYMIAAAIVSNLVYAINGISAYAATCTYTHNSYITDRRGANNLSGCSSVCSLFWAGADSWRASYIPAIRSCICFVMDRRTATGTWQYAAYGACGRRNECAITYRTCDTCANRSTVYTGDVICNSDNSPGYAGYISVSSKYVDASEPYWIYSTMCNCCPCIGNGPKYESCLGSQNSAPYSSMIRVMAKPGATAISDCYVVGNAYDPTGLYEYTDTDKCYYKTDTVLVPGTGIPVAPGTGIPVGPGGVEVATSIVP